MSDIVTELREAEYRNPGHMLYGHAAEVIEELRRELEAAGCIFRAYEALHLEKGTPDGNEKAARNAGFAATIERTVASTRGDA